MTVRSHRPGGPTLTDVARAAAVSLATASRVFSGAATVGPALAARVLEAGQRLGYHPNAAAQMTANGRSPLIGVITDQPGTAHFATILRGIVHTAGDHGLTAMVFEASTGAASYTTAVSILVGYQPRAIILVPRGEVLDIFDPESPLHRFGSRAGVIVGIGRSTPGNILPRIALNDASGAADIAREMGRRGYTRPLVLGTGEAFPTEAARTRALADGADMWSEFVELELASKPTRDAGYAAATSALERATTPPDIVMAASDELAVGAMAALRDLGITPGAQVAVTGFDNLPQAADLDPALTTVDTGLEAAGAHAVLLALGREGDDTSAPPARLIVRDSTPHRTALSMRPSGASRADPTR